MKTTITSAIVAVALVCSSSLTYAAEEDRTKATAKAGETLPKKDLAFLTEAAQGGMFEVQLAKVAERKATNAMSKDMAKMMIKDHTNANSELKALAASKKVQLPAELDAKHKGMLDKVAEKEGAEFDKAYFAALETAHKKDVAGFEKASESAEDPDLKAFATKTLPVLRKHLEHVKTHQSHLKGS
ncbi:MAG TPA: DUF4142 domain-containing protein [Chthoniobacteraceae bacterium]|jgi:putative membrane protein|nr:DUF4142 domain-containing protein [Chthoniobacteraceae bacterium]